MVLGDTIALSMSDGNADTIVLPIQSVTVPEVEYEVQATWRPSENVETPRTSGPVGELDEAAAEAAESEATKLEKNGRPDDDAEASGDADVLDALGEGGVGLGDAVAEAADSEAIKLEKNGRPDEDAESDGDADVVGIVVGVGEIATSEEVVEAGAEAGPDDVVPAVDRLESEETVPLLSIEKPEVRLSNPGSSVKSPSAPLENGKALSSEAATEERLALSNQYGLIEQDESVSENVVSVVGRAPQLVTVEQLIVPQLVDTVLASSSELVTQD